MQIFWFAYTVAELRKLNSWMAILFSLLLFLKKVTLVYNWPGGIPHSNYLFGNKWRNMKADKGLWCSYETQWMRFVLLGYGKQPKRQKGRHVEEHRFWCGICLHHMELFCWARWAEWGKEKRECELPAQSMLDWFSWTPVTWSSYGAPCIIISFDFVSR